MISISSQTTDNSHLQELKEKDIPLVFFDRVAENIDAPKITTDNYYSGIKATEHLIEKGCKRIAFISNSATLSIAKNRMNGYLDALKKNGIPRDESLIIYCSNDEKANNLLIRDLLKRKDRPDAIFSSVEKQAITCYEICEDLRINIPVDVKIISFSNLKTASLLNPSMTTITQPAYEIGREATSILFKIIEKKPLNLILDKTIFQAALSERNSTKGKEDAEFKNLSKAYHWFDSRNKKILL